MAPAEPPSELTPDVPGAGAAAPASGASPPAEAVNHAPAAEAALFEPFVPEAAPPEPAMPAAPTVPPAAPAGWPDSLSPLEQRIRRLEDALAQLQMQRGVDTRVIERPAAAAAAEPPPSPSAGPLSPSSAALLLGAGKRLLGAAADAVIQPASPLPPPGFSSGRRLGPLADLLAQLRAALRMYVDPRYKQSWPGRLLLPFLFAAIVLSFYWVPGSSIPLIGPFLVKTADLLLAYVFFKVLSREARRYRATAPDLPPTLRL